MAPQASPAQRIGELRAELELSQEEFAAKVNITRVAVVRWEKGSATPSTEAYVQLAKLAQEKSPSRALWFWEQAGVDEAALRTLVPEIDRSLKNFEKRLKNWSEKDPQGFVPVPLVEDLGHGTHENVLSRIHSAIREGVEVYVPFPKSAIETPQATACLRAPDDYMRPIVHTGDFLAVDVSRAGKPTSERAHEFAKNLTKELLLPLGDRAIFAVYYDRPSKPPRWRGRGGLHARAVTLTVDDDGKPTGRIHLTTEMGLNVAAAVQALGGKPKPFSDLEEASDIIIPVDPGVSLIGRVVAWIGSAWDPRRQSGQQHEFIDNTGTIGGYFNKFVADLAPRKPQKSGEKK